MMVPDRVSERSRIPPPATFDIDILPDSANLSTIETAAVIRRSPKTLEYWRTKGPDHPLKWRLVDGRPLYRVDAVRAYLAIEARIKTDQ